MGGLGGLKNIFFSNTSCKLMDGFKSKGTSVLRCQVEYLSTAFGFFPWEAGKVGFQHAENAYIVLSVKHSGRFFWVTMRPHG